MRTKPSATLRWRVSVYGPEEKENVPKGNTMIHKASRKRELADGHFLRFAKQIGNGKIGRVILHQGLLHRGTAYVENDTQWWNGKTGPIA